LLVNQKSETPPAIAHADIPHHGTISMLRKLVLVFAVTLSGCSTMQLPKQDLSSFGSSGTGVIVFSTESVKECIVHNIYMPLKHSYSEYTDAGTKAIFFITNKNIERNFPHTRGLLHVVELAAGEYDFWFRQRHPFVSANYKRPIPRFTVKPDEIRYLGSISVDGCLYASIKINDRYKRDVEEFRILYPGKATTQIDSDILVVKPGAGEL